MLSRGFKVTIYYPYKCNNSNCGNGGGCVHRLIDLHCPYCGYQLVEVITTGFRYCSNHSLICDYECFGEVDKYLKTD